jgi:ribosomal protein S18 acetylase RimI-like enzyme
MTSTAAALLMERLGLSEDELCRALGVDPLSVIGGDLDDKPQLPILLALTADAAERVGEEVLRRWLRTAGPPGRPLDHLLAGEYAAFESDLAALADRGFVLRGGGGAAPAAGGRVRIRLIASDEAETLRDVRLRALADTPLAFGSTLARESAYPPERWAAWARDSAQAQSQATFFAVDEASQAAVGLVFGLVDAEDPTLAHMFSMWVAPEARRTGAGGALVEAIVAWATARGVRRMRTAVTIGNDGAARLYERAGFRDTGVREPLGHSDAELVVLERALAA